MSRILFTWELGANYGHLTRLIPLAKEQLLQGREVLFAVNNLDVAECLLTPLKLPYVIAPKIKYKSHRRVAKNYAELLLNCGYDNQEGLTQAIVEWLNLFKDFRPDLLVIDHSPTALLANRITKISTIQIGTGFEVPPQDDWPALFPLNASQQVQLEQSELTLLINMNNAIEPVDGMPIQSVRDLFNGCQQILCTYAELDHYQNRKNALYVDPVFEKMCVESVAWSLIKHKKVFVYVWPDMPGLHQLLKALGEMELEVIAVIPNISATDLNQLSCKNLRIYNHAIDFSELLKKVDLLVSHGYGTVNTFLRSGIPVLLIPKTLEQFILGQCIKKHGYGLMPQTRSVSNFKSIINTLLGSSSFYVATQKFAKKYSEMQTLNALHQITQVINNKLTF